ncbi:MAG: hypothetical protein ABJB86_20155 [Bacteroidota bacterium]
MNNEDETVAALKTERRRLQAELARIDKALLDLNKAPIHFLNWKQKGLEFLEQAGCYSQSALMLQWVFSGAPGTLSSSYLRRKYITALSVALHDLNGQRIIKKFRVPKIQGDFYGLPAWFEQDGSLKKEYYGDTLIRRFPERNLLLKAR